jgi:hypothetical protein
MLPIFYLFFISHFPVVFFPMQTIAQIFEVPVKYPDIVKKIKQSKNRPNQSLLSTKAQLIRINPLKNVIDD